MKTTAKLALAAAGVGLAISQVRRSRVRAQAEDAQSEPASRWRSVTVNKPADQVAGDRPLPGPLADLGDSVEVRIAAAPGGKGTELAARLRTPEPSGAADLPARLAGHDPRLEVREALRRSKALLEVGEVMRVDPQPHGERPATPPGRLLDMVTRRAGAEGVL